MGKVKGGVYYDFVVMPYGLVKAPSVFQAFVHGVFWEMTGKLIEPTRMMLSFPPGNIIYIAH